MLHILRSQLLSNTTWHRTAKTRRKGSEEITLCIYLIVNSNVNIDAQIPGTPVGYESLSQFSRECGSHFGAPADL
jgi:hypothetical protein